MRKSRVLLFYLGFNLILVVLMFAHASWKQAEGRMALEAKAALVKKLGITDLCLWTEASYTRHLSQADRHTPFQDGPFSLDHFPSGSLAGVPWAVKRMYEKRD